MIHSAPCKNCHRNMTALCKPYDCKEYLEHKEIMIAYKERRLDNMKCKKCHSNMNRKQIDNTFYYECPKCGTTLGKPAEKEETSNVSEDK